LNVALCVAAVVAVTVACTWLGCREVGDVGLQRISTMPPPRRPAPPARVTWRDLVPSLVVLVLAVVA
jgi:hypothetical protein